MQVGCVSRSMGRDRFIAPTVHRSIFNHTHVIIQDDEEPGDPGDPQPEMNVVEYDVTVPDESGDLDFGSPTVGNAVERTLTVQNTGEDVLTWTGISLPAGFSTDFPGGTTYVNPTSNMLFRVWLTAAAAGEYGGQLRIFNNDDPSDGDTENPDYSFNVRGIVIPVGSITVSVNDVAVVEGQAAVFTVAISRPLNTDEQVIVQ